MIIKYYIILLLLILLFFIPAVDAVTNVYVNPTCLKQSYDIGYKILLTGYAPGGNGNTTSADISSVGYFTPSTPRIHYTTNVICSLSDPVVSGDVPGKQRIWGINSNGVLFYTDLNDANYASGFYNEGFFGCSIDGNCNEIYVVANLTAAANSRPLAIDPSGAVYVRESTYIQKLDPDVAYVPANFFNLASYTKGATFVDVTAIQTDSSGNVYTLVTSTGAGCAPLYCLQMIAITPAGALLKNDTVFSTGGIIINGSQGGLAIDSTNPTTNYTYAYYQSTAPAGVYLKHNSSAGTTDISASPLAAPTSVMDILYRDSIIFLSSRQQNNVYAYATNFTGFVGTGTGATGAVEITYATKIIDTLYSNYYNNSDFQIYYRINVNKLSNLGIPDFEIYKYKVVLFDPNGIPVGDIIHFGPLLVCGFLSCAMNETLTYPAPSVGWQNGSWYANLYEYNTETFNTALLDTSTTWTVLNQTFNGTVQPPTPDINSGTGSQALAIIDGWTAMFGLGVNQVSKFLFAMFIIVVFMVIGLVLTKMSFTGAVVFGVMPYCFFIYITYLPMWTVVILGIVIAMKIGIFR